jgi:hypothetical protein
MNELEGLRMHMQSKITENETLEYKCREGEASRFELMGELEK